MQEESPSQRPRLAWLGTALTAAGMAAILAGYVAATHLLGKHRSQEIFLVFHTSTELFSVLVGCCIFVITWNCRKIIDNNYLLFLGISSLFVAIINVAHLLSYSGMAVFPGYSADLPTQLWISMRYMQALSLLAAPLFLRRTLPVGSMMAVYAIATATLLVMCFTDVFPNCWIEPTADQQGHLTTFKIASEYAATFLMLASLLPLRRLRNQFDPSVMRKLQAAIVCLALAGMAFTLYKDPFDLMNLSGHLLIIGCFLLIYKAVIQTGLTRPYELLFYNLKTSEEALRQSERRYRALAEFSPFAIFIHRRGRILYANPAAIKLLGEDQESTVIGHDLWEWSVPDDVMTMQDRTRKVTTEGEVLPPRETALCRHDGTIVEVEAAGTGIPYEEHVCTLHVMQDITIRTKARRDREELLHQLQAEQARLFAVIESAPEGIVVVDDRCRVLTANPAAWGVFGRTILPGEDVAAHPQGQGLGAAFDSLKLPVARSVTEGVTVRNHEVSLVRTDSQVRDLLASTAPIRNVKGELLGAVCIFQDVTERKQIERERERMVEALGKVRSALELRVQERTADLSQVVETLQAEVEARIAAEAERQRLEAEVLKTSELERQRIGHDLHDGLGQNLAGTAFLSTSLSKKLAAKSMPEAEEAAEIDRLIRMSVQEARNLARGLSPVGMSGEDICKALADLAMMIDEVYRVPCYFQGDASVSIADRAVATHVYRIAQEAAANACKHASPARVDIVLGKLDGHVRLAVEDDGVGLPEKIDGQTGMGLRIMQYRANRIGANFSVRRRAQGGTIVECVLSDGSAAAAMEKSNGKE